MAWFSLVEMATSSYAGGLATRGINESGIPYASPHESWGFVVDPDKIRNVGR